MHVAYEEVKKDAEELSLAVTGSELVKSTMILKIKQNLFRLVWFP